MLQRGRGRKKKLSIQPLLNINNFCIVTKYSTNDNRAFYMVYPRLVSLIKTMKETDIDFENLYIIVSEFSA